MTDFSESAARDAFARFAILSRIAKMRRRLANIGDVSDLPRASDASETLVAFADECSALGVPASGRELAAGAQAIGEMPLLKRQPERLFRNLGKMLDRHVDRSGDPAGQRRQILSRVRDYATASPDDDVDFSEVAKKLNGGVKRLGASARRRTARPAVGGFTSEDARNLVELVRSRNDHIERTVRQFGTIFRDPSHDDIHSLRDSLNPRLERSNINNAIATLEIRVLKGIGPSQRALLQRTGHEQAERTSRALAAERDKPDASTTSLEAKSRNPKRRLSASFDDSPLDSLARKRARQDEQRPGIVVHQDTGPVATAIVGFHEHARQANSRQSTPPTNDENVPPADQPPQRHRNSDRRRSALQDIDRGVNSR